MWQLGQQVITLGAGDVDDASALAAESDGAVEMPRYVHLVGKGDAGLVAE